MTTEVDLVGTLAGEYRIASRLGSGTMGHVYAAEHTANGNRVALKVLHKHHQKELAPRFLREGKTLALLSHPNIVQLVDMGQLADGTLYLATELVAGGSLRDVMNTGALEPTRALLIVRQLLDALDAAHALGVVHRDIKPENIMLAVVADKDFVKVLDFGVAKLLADTVAGLGEANLTTAGLSVFGSALYIAPESATGQKIDARLDLYSTGAMLYEMLAGRPPFDHEDPLVLLRMHAFDPPPTLAAGAPGRTFTPELEALVARALAKTPDERYRSAADMIGAVDAAVRSLQPPETGTVARARPHERTDVVRVTPQRKRMVVGAAAVALVLVVVAGVVMARNGDASSAATKTARADLAAGHAQFAEGRPLDALAAYERAMQADPKLGGDATLRANLVQITDGKDSLATVVALDLLAELAPPAHDVIVTYAEKGKLADGRRRASMIAERERIADRIDRIEARLLDLQQTSSCEQRKALIEELAASGDKRALPGIKRARASKCVEP